MSALVVTLLRALLRAYQICVSPLLGPTCRFAPSCSEYAREALARHGLLRGSLLAAKRLGRCHPWHAGGYDPVPLASAPVTAEAITSAGHHRDHTSRSHA